MGMFQVAFDAGMAVGAMALGIVAQVAGYPAMFLIAAGMAVVGLGYFVVRAGLDPTT